jgi:hypothetical protein
VRVWSDHGRTPITLEATLAPGRLQALGSLQQQHFGTDASLVGKDRSNDLAPSWHRQRRWGDGGRRRLPTPTRSRPATSPSRSAARSASTAGPGELRSTRGNRGGALVDIDGRGSSPAPSQQAPPGIIAVRAVKPRELVTLLAPEATGTSPGVPGLLAFSAPAFAVPRPRARRGCPSMASPPCWTRRSLTSPPAALRLQGYRLAHRRASHLRRPQSQRHRPRTLVPFLLRTARGTTRFVCGAQRGRQLRDYGFPGFGPVAHLLTVLACPLGSHRKWRNEATRPTRTRTERIAFWPRARR